MEDTKTFNVRLKRDSWRFLKVYAIDHKISMNEVIKRYVEKLQRNSEKKVDDK